jgi:hypothetical protein
MNEYNYTISSKYSDDYSYVKTSLHPPPTHMSELIVNNLTTEHSFRTLGMQDYMIIQLGSEGLDRRYQIDRDYSNLTRNKLSAILNKMFNPDLTVYHDDENRFVLYTRPMKQIKIIEMSYNFQILTGTLRTKFPIESKTKHSWIAPQRRYLDIKDDEYLERGEYFYIEEPYIQHLFYYRGPRLLLSSINDFQLQNIIRHMLDNGHDGISKPDIYIRFTNRYNHYITDKYEYFVLLRDNMEIHIPYITPKLAKLIGSIQQQRIEEPRIHYVPEIPRSVKSGVHYYRSDSVGYFNLTPVLYLISNLGSSCYSNGKDDEGNFILDNRRIVMRINNYFISGLPIIANNIEFSSTVPSGSLTNIWFRLVDSNYQPVKLLTPMEISLVVIGIEEQPIQLPIYNDNNLL